MQTRLQAERENWKPLLKNQNYDLVATDNTKSARRMWLRLQPDLGLFDNHLAQVRGANSSRRLKQDLLNQLTPVVLVSSNPTLAELVEGRDAGAADFSGTPSSLRKGLGRVESLWRLKCSIDEQANSVILFLAHRVEARHSRADGHSDRLAEHAMQLGESLGLSARDLQELHLACLLHDIGKVAVPDKILLKRARLNPEETEIVRQHPVTLTSDRPYREAVSTEGALRILHQEAMCGWLDASLVWSFSRIRRSGDYFSIRRRPMRASCYGYLKVGHSSHGIANA